MWSLDRPEGDYEGLSTSTRSIDQSIPWKKNRTIPESGIRVFVIGEDRAQARYAGYNPTIPNEDIHG
jgi:hypothetical protein